MIQRGIFGLKKDVKSKIGGFWSVRIPDFNVTSGPLLGGDLDKKLTVPQ